MAQRAEMIPSVSHSGTSRDSAPDCGACHVSYLFIRSFVLFWPFCIICYSSNRSIVPVGTKKRINIGKICRSCPAFSFKKVSENTFLGEKKLSFARRFLARPFYLTS